jgi:AraC-like DNA-binding protein
MQLIVEKPSPLVATDLVACEIIRGAGFGCVWHHHPALEITWVKSGGTERWVGDKLTPIVPGDLVLLGSDLPHDYRNDCGSGQRARKVEAIVVQFMPHLLGEGWLKLAAMKPVQRLFHRARLGLEISGATRQRVIQRLMLLAKAKGLRRVVVLLEILDDLAKSKELKEIASPGFRAEIGADSSDRLGTVVAYIEEHLSESLYVPTLAAMSGLSESAFSRLFKKCTGRTVPQYVNELRIARACRLLAETDDTVGEIANACGYNTPAHFQRQFREHQKRSPQVYRQAVRRHG